MSMRSWGLHKSLLTLMIGKWGAARSRREKLIAKFEMRHGYTPDLEAPKKFSEKLLKRILEDHDPHYRLYGVKIFAPYFLKNRAINGLNFPERLKVVRHMRPSDFHDLPESFVVKSSFGSGKNKIVTQKARLDIESVCRRFNGRRDKITNAQGNTDTENCFIFEAFLGDPTLGPPDDYKFHCFHSADGTFTCFPQIDTDRFGKHRQTLFDQEFNPIDMQFSGQVPHEEPPACPDNFAELIQIAKEVSAGFDYVRVDLYNTMDGVFFGEITPFHQGGMARIQPVEWEDRLGALWDQHFPSLQLAKT